VEKPYALYLSDTVPGHLARESAMKRFTSVYQSIFLGKTPIVLVALILLGSVVGGSLILHSTNRTNTVNCSSPTMQYSASSITQSCTKATHHSQVQTTGQTIHIPQGEVIGPELLSIPRQIAPTPTPVPQPVKINPTPVPTIPIPTSPGQAAVIAIIKQVFGSYAPGALQVAKCESGLNPLAYNPISIGGSHAAGLFQILYPSTWDSTSEASSSPYSAMANALAAHQIFVRDGYSWHEWTCLP
jgi:hypothetical protein